MLQKANVAIKTNKLTSLLKVMSAFVLVVFFMLQHIGIGSSAELTTRSIRVGSSLPSEVTTHEFRFNTNTAGSVGSIKFDYCTNLPFYGAPCTIPSGLAVNTAGIALQSGITGFSVSGSSDSNTLIITRTSAATIPLSAVYRFSNITNQNSSNQTVYVRISTHSSIDGTGAPIDNGAVVYATAEGVGVGGFVPPYLTFCVGVTVSINCSTAEGSLLDLGELSANEAKTATSQFAGATNDESGYNVFITGGTMTSGNEIIPALETPTASSPGTSQFGINLRSNSNPSIGANVSGSGTAAPISGYATSNSYKYVNGELIARSNVPTNYNRFTVTYLVNISEDQRPGFYASSFTFTAIATF